MSKTIFHFCGTCGLYQSDAKACPLMPHLNGKINSNDYCSQYIENPIRCATCNTIVLTPFVTLGGDNIYHYYCQECVPR